MCLSSLSDTSIHQNNAPQIFTEVGMGLSCLFKDWMRLMEIKICVQSSDNRSWKTTYSSVFRHGE